MARKKIVENGRFPYGYTTLPGVERMKKAIIIGASSGIGRELAGVFSENNYIVGLAARRLNLLKKLQQELPNQSHVKYIDLLKIEDIEKNMNELITEMGDVDVIVISSGTGYLNDGLEWDREKETIDVNVTGFARIVTLAANYFLHRGEGHIVGISSVGALRGNNSAPAYNASKAFVSNYLEGIRYKMKKSNRKITVTDIMPGFVDTDMAKGEGLFWVSPPETAARQIYRSIVKKKERAYITRRWRIIAFLLKIMPDCIYFRL
jgi:short-subunit dehydrogenase